ncbi:hypothetical protein [Dickeya aquatica]|uniref:Uncharacterized protein n=1 Tax=Dickeya aquatica TaxID=1401087 RepID=A0A375AEH2_9GAMM|nr:hypothetical protein [Dickeya aquatica]SLM64490.1 hypothetical protein DAQ1742_03696 [Dickeya aquatica]
MSNTLLNKQSRGQLRHVGARRQPSSTGWQRKARRLSQQLLR